MSKRMSLMPSAPAVPPTPVHYAGNVAVMGDAIAVVGSFPVTVSSESVIHPRSRLDAKGGPVNIGQRCIVEERAAVGGGSALSAEAGRARPEGSVTLGDCVTVETGATVEAGAVVGQGSTVGARSVVASGAVIGRYCTLAPRTVVNPGERIPDFTVLYGGGRRRHDGRPGMADTRHRQQARKIEVLRKLVTSVPEKYMAKE